ncbi:hypothetical protein GCM10017783_22530 [Deinococcus piscis]|uniref:Lipoprotein n=1 Tax=Deinococcus piscis TaxID=394230 RepID=A0ABQ3KGC9_9DEIO|nr:hypothetical protein [Deinococcus piscis]GHG09459.1 hypothetical protein GCM10017783_22530 [Deinococcus piscis]
MATVLRRAALMGCAVLIGCAAPQEAGGELELPSGITAEFGYTEPVNPGELDPFRAKLAEYAAQPLTLGNWGCVVIVKISERPDDCAGVLEVDDSRVAQARYSASRSNALVPLKLKIRPEFDAAVSALMQEPALTYVYKFPENRATVPTDRFEYRDGELHGFYVQATEGYTSVANLYPQ